ncbi:cytochrome P450 [Nocardia vaccinii]|uniref:cytochrome P450 n=1 Tax=Nocardia vaccinii TaxID=1822 RepID=UPI00082C7CD5|nr:cytochrome P450 [Nocardia vaccinii]
MAFLLLVAGHETTVNLIGNGVHALLRNPAQFEALRADPSGVPDAVEEFLRHDGPVSWSTVRYTAEPIRIGDADIPAGEIVYVAVDAMNRDPDRFHDSETLLISRDTSGHVAFGHGIHNCVGAPLARLEAHIAFTALLQRFPKLALADEAFTPSGRPAYSYTVSANFRYVRTADGASPHPDEACVRLECRPHRPGAEAVQVQLRPMCHPVHRKSSHRSHPDRDRSWLGKAPRFTA